MLNFPIRTDRWLVSALTATLCWGVMETVRAGAPAQTPLLSGSGAVAPNVVFTLDDSGSMLSAIMPELYTSSTTGGSVAIQVLTPNEAANPVATVSSGANGYYYRLLPTRVPTGTSDTQNETQTYVPVPSGSTAQYTADTSTLLDAYRRSSRFNTIYYNPETLYKPWTKADGTLMEAPQANGSGQWVVRLDPVIDAGTIDLSRRPGSVSGSDNDSFDPLSSNQINNLVWCATITSSGGQNINSFQESSRCGGSSNFLFNTFHVASWYEFNDAGTQARRVSLNAAIRSTNSATNTAKAAVTFTRGAARTDCSAGTGNARNCSWDQEMANYATWFVYYRTRLLLAKGAVAKAFASNTLPDFRFGYGALNNVGSNGSAPNITVDGVANTQTLVAGVRRYTDAKTAFYTWLFNKIAYSGTPLRSAIGDVGLYFSRQGLTNSGNVPTAASNTTRLSPWADDADLGTSNYRTVSSYAGCRRAFHILTTDGYWTAGSDYEASESGARADVEATNGTTITGTDNRSYTYNASAAVNARYRDGRSNMLADASMFYWKKDLASLIPNAIVPNDRNPAFWQHLVNYTVGLGTSGNLSSADLPAIEAGTKRWPNATDTIGNEEKSDDLLHAAYNSRGLNLNAANADEFAAQLQQILNDITSQTFSTAGVATSGSTLTSGFAKYVPSYVAGTWTGDLSKFAINSVTGRTVDQNPSTPILDPVWSANAVMRAPADRNIYVWDANSAVAFSFDAMSTGQKSDMGTLPFAPSANLINYLRGDDSNEGTGATQYRVRGSKLGDIVNSNPLYVKNTVDYRYQLLGGTLGSSYRTFLTGQQLTGSVLPTIANRTATVFVGANDGMLHGFRDSDGQETFAFVPRAALPNISKLAGKPYDHRFFVDGPLTEVHAVINGRWKSILLGSMGAGGRSIFAIDITTTATMGASNVLWEFNSSTGSSSLGHVTSEIEVGPVKLNDGTYKWVALVGNGLNSTTSSTTTSNKAQLLVIDVGTGALLATLNTGVGTDADPNGLGGVRAIRNSEGVIQAAYAGDLKGNVWRFNFSGAASATGWQVAKSGGVPTPLYRATDRANPGVVQAITAAPTVLLHPRGGVMVVVGTGKLLEASDRIGTGLTQQQTIYGVRDLLEPYDSTANTNYATVGFSSLQNQTINANSVATPNGTSYFALTQPSGVNWDEKRGWYMDLTLATGQRLIYPGTLFSGYVYVSTVVPADTGSCSNAGGFDGVFDALNGTVNGKRLFDTNGNGVLDNGDISSSWYETPADGRKQFVTPPRQTVTDPDNPNPGPGDGECGAEQYRVISATSAAPVCMDMGRLTGSRTWRVLTTPPQ